MTSAKKGPLTLEAQQLAELNYVNRSLAVACTRGREAVVYRFREILNREDLSEQQWRVLRILSDLGSMTSVEIGTLACIHKVSISRIIKQLEARNFVKRSASESDGRASYVALTEEGRKRMAPLLADASQVHLSIAEDFGYDKYLLLLDLLKQLASINDK